MEKVLNQAELLAEAILESEEYINMRLTEQAGFSANGYRLRFQQLLATPILFAAMSILAAAFSLRLARLGGLAGLAGPASASDSSCFSSTSSRARSPAPTSSRCSRPPGRRLWWRCCQALRCSATPKTVESPD